MEPYSKILILGANGMLGKSLSKKLKSKGFNNILKPSRQELNLLNVEVVNKYFKAHQPDYVFFLAAKVGGIQENIKSPADFGYINGVMQLNVIENCRKYHVKKMLFIGSSCIYPKECLQPMKEEYLLSGKLEDTNQMYALAKIFGLKLCESYNKQYGTNFITCMPPNLYGPHDHFDETAHVMSSLIKKFHEGKINNSTTVTCFGTGTPKREFLFIDDLSEACIFLIKNYNENTHINIGSGTDISIKDLAYKIKDIIGYTGEIQFDTSKPDGMMRKCMDVSKINDLGWKSSTSLDTGINITYNWFKEHIK